MPMSSTEVRSPGDRVAWLHRQCGWHGGLRDPSGAQHQGEDDGGVQLRHGHFCSSQRCGAF